MQSKLRKVNKILGKNLVFRDVRTTDAEFIIDLRTDLRIGKYLSATSKEITKQEKWINDYVSDSTQAYFIIESMDGKKLGTVRLYDPQGLSFCWGSWILKAGAPKTAAIESALMVYSFAVNFLGFQSAHFNVHKSNVSVWQFHERFGAVRLSEAEQNYSYKICAESIYLSFEKYKKYLPEIVKVEL